MANSDSHLSRFGPFSWGLPGISFLSTNTWNQAASRNPIWCLGRKYVPDPAGSADYVSASAPHPAPKSSLAASRTDPATPATPGLAKSTLTETIVIDDVPASFIDEYNNLLNFTYRERFPPIPVSVDSNQPLPLRLIAQASGWSGPISDSGWGCMIRTGQSLLANALLALELDSPKQRSRQEIETSVVSLFADHSSAPFSIHNIVQQGRERGQLPGTWFRPSLTADCLCELATPDTIRVYVPKSPKDIVEEDFFHISIDDAGNFHPTLILAPCKFTPDGIPDRLRPSLMALFEMPQSMGIAGGQQGSSYYFVAKRGPSELIYFDPHFTKPAIPPSKDRLTDAQYQDYVNTVPRTTALVRGASSIFSHMMAKFAVTGPTRTASPSRPTSSHSLPGSRKGSIGSAVQVDSDLAVGSGQGRPGSLRHQRSWSQPGLAAVEADGEPLLKPIEHFLDSCHTSVPFAMDISRMNSAMILGFLIRDIADWKDWRARAEATAKGIIEVDDFPPDINHSLDKMSLNYSSESEDDSEDETVAQAADGLTVSTPNPDTFIFCHGLESAGGRPGQADRAEDGPVGPSSPEAETETESTFRGYILTHPGNENSDFLRSADETPVLSARPSPGFDPSER